MRLATALTLGVALTAAPAAAEAFCGFYVSGADAKLYNNATMVVLMREGTRTVLSMQNNYQGPPQDFAMVVPVPVVLQEENVKTLPPEVFDRVDQLASPRLVEYWEQDPCNPQVDYDRVMMAGAGGAPEMEEGGGGDDEHGVKIEARFTVGEYEILILSAQDSTGLDTWLRVKKYRIPAGAEKLLRPYVTQGMKFFVAKVNVKKVKKVNGRIMLSPLRFHYDSHQFNLPIRLGLVNSGGTQDLLVHILAAQRFEVANYQNVTIPTNLDVSNDTREAFGAFYAALFDATVAKHEGAVITEYSWDAGSCDPCPTPPLDDTDLATLGADVMPSGNASFTLTRLHARYGKDTVGEDLVFRVAPAIVGGREMMNEGGKLERGARQDPSMTNNFQARYVIRHEWTGPIACEKPQRGVWGGPPGGGEPPIRPAAQIAFAPRDRELSSFLRQDVEEIDYKVSQRDTKAKFKPSGIPPKGGSCAGCSAAGGGGFLGLFALIGLAAAVLGRRKVRGR